MGKEKSLLFNLIAPVYGLFYSFQKNLYREIVDNVKSEMNIAAFHTILDVGCGTGAFCCVLKDMGMNVTGIDQAIKMLNVAKNKPENRNIDFIQANILEGLPFSDKSFDIAIASYVAHGLNEEARKLMYAEMSRVTRSYVIFHDYNSDRSLLTSVVEWLEGGNYFHFIKNVEHELETHFSELRVIKVDLRANWYICKPLE